MGHVHLSGLGSRQGSLLLHKEHRQLLDLWLLPVVIGISLEDHLLPLVPLLHDIAAGANGILPIILAVGVLRHDAHDGHGVGPDGKGSGHMKFHDGVIHRHCLLQHGEIVDGAFLLAVIVSKGHILGGELFPVGEGHVVPNLHGPGETVLADRIISSQILIYL